MLRRESMERLLVRYGGQDPWRLREQDDSTVESLIQRLKAKLTVPDDASTFLPVPSEELR